MNGKLISFLTICTVGGLLALGGAACGGGGGGGSGDAGDSRQGNGGTSLTDGSGAGSDDAAASGDETPGAQGSGTGTSGGGTSPGGGTASIVGTWTCEMSGPDGTPMGQGSFTFTSDGVLQTAQGTAAYQLTGGGQLLVSSGGQEAAYQVDALTDTTLEFRYSDGSTFSCQRGEGGSGQAEGGTGTQPGGGDTALLYGEFCHFSGSSIGGTYGKLTSISFDGQGRWSMGGETYSSGSAGTFYGEGAQDSGTYSVQGQTIYYQTSDGYQGTAQVYVQQPTGEITEIVVEGDIYAKALCNM
ncbi:MAG: hypothetical protein GXP50_05460 [Deltaproteobacteria bacterium]|nr:hypothetical protein [Deltaproteobacteria bacterium]